MVLNLNPSKSFGSRKKSFVFLLIRIRIHNTESGSVCFQGGILILLNVLHHRAAKVACLTEQIENSITVPFRRLESVDEQYAGFALPANTASAAVSHRSVPHIIPTTAPITRMKTGHAAAACHTNILQASHSHAYQAGQFRSDTAHGNAIERGTTAAAERGTAAIAAARLRQI
jgi:hypothetical protein